MIEQAKRKLGLGSAPSPPPGIPDAEGEGSLQAHEMPDGSIELRAPGEGPLSEQTPGSDAAPDDDPTIRRPYRPGEEYQFRSMRSSRYRGDDAHYHHQGRGSTLWDRLNDLVSVEPVTPATLDPAIGDPIQVSAMAGFRSGEDHGHDAFQGVDGMVTGEVDARQFLGTPSATPGSPMQMGPGESIFSDDVGFGDMGLQYELTEGERASDTAELEYREPGAGYECGAFDWCSEL